MNRRWLAPLGALYLSVSGARQRLYDRGRLAAHRVAVPVIGVGNLTAGGTGKTPAVQWIAAQLGASGQRVAIVARGYGGRPPYVPLTVYAAGRLQSDAAAAGDEPILHAQRVQPHLVIVDPDRVRAAQRAIELGAQVIVLDDGFQHRRLARDVDLVLLDATDPLGGAQGLPSGFLREPARGLRRADVVIFTRAPQSWLAAPMPLAASYWPAAVSRWLDPARQLILAAAHIPSNPIDPSGAAVSLAALRGRRLYWVSGIAAPDSFVQALDQLGVALTGGRAFADHHRFSAAQATALQRAALASGAEALIVTGKDRVRWPEAGGAVWSLDVTFAPRGESLLLARIASALTRPTDQR